MKRLPFKKEHEQPVKDGLKCFTSRWRLTVNVGDIVAAVTGKPGKPAFLTPAAEAFVTLKITSVDSMFWKDFTEDHAAKCGVTRAWYMKERPGAGDFDRIHLIGFEVTGETK